MSQELFPGREVPLARWALYASGRWGLHVNHAVSKARLLQDAITAQESSGDLPHDVAPGRVASCEGKEHGAMGLLLLSCCLSINTIVVRCAGSC